MVDDETIKKLIHLDPGSIDPKILTVLFGLAVGELERLGEYLESHRSKKLSSLETSLDAWLELAQDYLD